ncbi:helix-turn-helix domain-containing protein [Arthrobacter sp. R3-55]
METVQDVIEALAQDLHRSVAVDDADLALVASSTHFEDADRVRLESLTTRRVSGRARDYVLAAGVRTWRAPKRLGPKPEIGADNARHCYPLWSRYELLGFMWVMEATPMSAEEVGVANAAALKVREILARKVQAEADETQEMETLAFSLLSPDPHDRQLAATDAMDLGFFKGATHFTVFAVSADNIVGNESETESAATLLGRAFHHLVRSRASKMTMTGVSDNDSVVILGHRTTYPEGELREIGIRVLKELKRLSPERGRHVHIGIGTTQQDLADIATSFDRAQQAAHLARRVGAELKVWGEDSLEVLFDALLSPQARPHLVPDVIRTVESRCADMLELVEVFLDQAGNVIRTAEQMHLHRTTVYYRLGRFQETSGLSLEDGGTRLLLHLWLKARRRLEGL